VASSFGDDLLQFAQFHELCRYCASVFQTHVTKKDLYVAGDLNMGRTVAEREFFARYVDISCLNVDHTFVGPWFTGSQKYVLDYVLQYLGPSEITPVLFRVLPVSQIGFGCSDHYAILSEVISETGQQPRCQS
jgi:hypothetical protein